MLTRSDLKLSDVLSPSRSRVAADHARAGDDHGRDGTNADVLRTALSTTLVISQPPPNAGVRGVVRRFDCDSQLEQSLGKKIHSYRKVQ